MAVTSMANSSIWDFQKRNTMRTAFPLSYVVIAGGGGGWGFSVRVLVVLVLVLVGIGQILRGMILVGALPLRPR